jgi:hypothetical protein
LGFNGRVRESIQSHAASGPDGRRALLGVFADAGSRWSVRVVRTTGERPASAQPPGHPAPDRAQFGDAAWLGGWYEAAVRGPVRPCGHGDPELPPRRGLGAPGARQSLPEARDAWTRPAKISRSEPPARAPRSSRSISVAASP